MIPRGEKEVPRAEAERCLEAEHDPILAAMLRRKLPLTRNAYLAMCYGADLPEPHDWTVEHEIEVPECFRDADAVKPDPRRKQRDRPDA